MTGIRKNQIAAAAVLAYGIFCGILNSIDNGMWLTMSGKFSQPPSAIFYGIISLSCAVGNYVTYLATGSQEYNRYFFWPGQLIFYAAVGISILMLKRGEKSPSRFWFHIFLSLTIMVLLLGLIVSRF